MVFSVLMYAEIIVLLLAVFYTLLSFFLQRKLSNMQRVYEIQKLVKEKSNELNTMVKNNATKDELAAKQKEVMGLLSENMKYQFKPMLIILPFFLVFWYVLLPAIFPSTLTFQVASFKLNYRIFFILIAFVLGFILSIAVMLRDRKRLKAKEQNVVNSNSSNQGV